MSDTESQRVYTPAEAVKYLEEVRGIRLSVTALRMRRFRHKATTNRVLDRISLWTQEELDAIEPSARSTAKREDQQEAA